MLIIMLKKLQSDTDAAVQYLKNSVKTMRITNYDGEDVSRVVSLIRGATKRLKNVGRALPDEYPKWILDVMQTSTESEFNEAFAHLARQYNITYLMDPTRDRYPPVDAQLRLWSYDKNQPVFVYGCQWH